MQLPPTDILVSWPKANYVDPATQGCRLTIVIILFLSLGFLVVGLRVFTRVHISKSFGLDDVFAMLAMIPATGYAVIAILANTQYHADRHLWDVPLDSALLNQKFVFAVQIMFSIASCLTKLSMLVLIRKMVIENPLRNIINVTIAFVTLSSISFINTVIFQCKPISDYWTLSAVPQECFNESANLLAAGIINTITDFCVISVPIPIVWKLRMSFRLRVSIILLFATSFFVCVVSIVRTVYTYKFNTSWDKTWDGYDVYLTASLELFVGIICCSIPPIKPFLKRHFPSIIPTMSSEYARVTPQYELSTRSSTFNRTKPLRPLDKQLRSGDPPTPEEASLPIMPNTLTPIPEARIMRRGGGIEDLEALN